MAWYHSDGANKFYSIWLNYTNITEYANVSGDIVVFIFNASIV